jgi:hypothetical protein
VSPQLEACPVPLLHYQFVYTPQSLTNPRLYIARDAAFFTVRGAGTLVLKGRRVDDQLILCLVDDQLILCLVWGWAWQDVLLPAIQEGRSCTWRDVEEAGIEAEVGSTEMAAWGFVTGPGRPSSSEKCTYVS